MRRSWLAFVALVLGLFLGGADRPPHAPKGVALFANGHQARTSEVDHVANAALRGTWLWTDRRAPRFFPGNTAPEFLEGEADPLLSVAVTLEGRQSSGHLRLIGAPVAMWETVAVGFLPSWVVSEQGRVEIPRDPTAPWRLRLAGADSGSWWRDIPAGTSRVAMRPVSVEARQIEIDDPNGQPVEGAAMTVVENNRNGEKVIVQLRSDRDGRVLFQGLPDRGRIRLVVNGEGYAPVSLQTRPSAFPTSIRLRPAVTLQARLFDVNGHPVEGADVVAESFIVESSGATVRMQTLSDDAGFWRLSGLPEGRLALRIRATGLAQLHRFLEEEAGTHDLGRMTLSPSRSVSIVLQDLEQNPIENGLAHGAGLSVASDSEGRLVFVSLPVETAFDLTVKARGFLTENLTVGPDQDELTVVMEKAFRIKGIFLDETGRPPARGIVRSTIGSSYDETPIEEGGRFVVDFAPGKEGVLSLRSAVTPEVRVEVGPGYPGEVLDLGEVRAPAGLVVRGSVLSAVDSSPVSGARLWVPRPDPQGAVVAWARGDLIEAESDSDGNFELAGLAVQPFLLRVDAPNLARLELEVTPEGDSREIMLETIYLDEGADVIVRAPEAPDGATARIDLHGEWLDLDFLTATVMNEEAKVKHVPSGSAVLTVLAGRMLLCEKRIEIPASGTHEVDCDRERYVVSGRVFLGDRPVQGGVLHWSSTEVSSRGAIIFNSSSPLGLRRQQTFGAGRPDVEIPVGEEGDFETESLLPGDWQVGLLASRAAGLPGFLSVHLPETRKHHVNLTFEPGSITGFVVDSAGEPVVRARVRDLESGAFAFSGAGGSFTLNGTQPGLHRLVARSGNLSSNVVLVEVRNGDAPDTVWLTLDENLRKQVQISVLLDDGTPASGAFVFLQGENGQEKFVTAGFDGSVVVSFQPPVPESLRVASFAQGRWSFGEWRSLEEFAEGVDVVVGRSGAVSLVSGECLGLVGISSSLMWDVSRLMRRVGFAPVARAGSQLLISGLPPGQYEFRCGKEIRTVTVRDGRIAELKLG